MLGLETRQAGVHIAADTRCPGRSAQPLCPSAKWVIVPPGRGGSDEDPGVLSRPLLIMLV